MIIPLPRWMMIGILVFIVAICITPMIGDGQILLYCIGWPLKVIGQFTLKWGLASLAFLALIRFGRRKLARR